MVNETTCVYCNKPIKEEIKFCPHCGKKQPQPDKNTFDKDPYEILQVSRDAEKEVIDAAYKSLARKYHPDTNKTDFATNKMQEINWAYGILKDEKSRKRWNQTNNNHEKNTRKEDINQHENEDKAKHQRENEEAEKRKREAEFVRNSEEERHQKQEYQDRERIRREKEASEENSPNFLLAIGIFSGICLLLYFISQFINSDTERKSSTYYSTQKPVSTKVIKVYPTNTPKPTSTPKPVSGDVVFQYDFDEDFARKYSIDETIYDEARNGNYIIGINPKYPDNFWWSYNYTDWGLDDYYDNLQYEFEINLINRNSHRITKEELELSAIPIEYGFYIGNIENFRFVSFSMVEWDGKVVGWNIGDNNSLYIRKPKNRLNTQFETCWVNFDSFYNESGLQASRGSLVYQNSLKSSCGFKFLDEENELFTKRAVDPIHLKILRNSMHIQFFVNDLLLQEIEFPEKFFIYNNQTEKYDTVNMEKSDLNTFGFVLYDYGETFEIEIDNFFAKIP